MYFSEKGNVDDDATLITIVLVSFNLQSCCLMQSAICGLQSAAQSVVCGMQFAVCGLQSAVCKCHTPLFLKDGYISLFSVCFPSPIKYF